MLSADPLPLYKAAENREFVKAQIPSVHLTRLSEGLLKMINKKVFSFQGSQSAY